LRAHAVDLGRGGGAVQAIQVVRAQGGVADQRRHVDRRARGLDRRDVVSERGKRKSAAAPSRFMGSGGSAPGPGAPAPR